jgi:hypothetical protein|uniref:Large polyvalent protein associated domain 30 n=1 Tax=Siphoviridae sp. ctEYW18 TaxID=2826208 RepID=A0A8S5M8R0_9CAUD|nr:MAG TPA: Large polyvalent protein associated domain 30 [Siphoviridae sp. ctEYW18]
MKIYIDSEYKCHVSNDGNMREFDLLFFDGKCTEFIEGYRYVPSGETWTRGDGEVFSGEMIAPWKLYTKLYKAQLEYEVAQYEAALSEIETALEVQK